MCMCWALEILSFIFLRSKTMKETRKKEITIGRRNPYFTRGRRRDSGSINDNVRGPQALRSAEEESSKNLQQKDSMTRQAFLPFDIQIKILSRLPVRSLLKFRCVCKQWCSLTYDPYFIDEHYKRSLARSPRITSWLIKKKVTLYDFDHETCGIKDFSFEIDLLLGLTKCRLSNFVNGLACACDEVKTGDCYLINPSTREVSKLPDTQRRVLKADEVGLGFDTSTGEFKVVRLLGRGPHEPYECIILTVGTHEWRSIGKAPTPVLRPVYSQGSLYWTAYVAEEQGGYCKVILRIDIKCEKFEVIPLIPALTEGCSIHLHESRGRVCVAMGQDIMKIWMLENNKKWIQVLSVCTRSCSRNYSGPVGPARLIGISGDKILIEFFTDCPSRICCHDLQNGTCNEIWNGTDNLLKFYWESLVSPRKLIGTQLE